MFDFENATEIEKAKFWLEEELRAVVRDDCAGIIRSLDRYIMAMIKEHKTLDGVRPIHIYDKILDGISSQSKE